MNPVTSSVARYEGVLNSDFRVQCIPITPHPSHFIYVHIVSVNLEVKVLNHAFDQQKYILCCSQTCVRLYCSFHRDYPSIVLFVSNQEQFLHSVYIIVDPIPWQPQNV